MARWIKLSLKILSACIGLVILIWLFGAYYISKNRKEILSSILTQVNKKISGTLTATGMEPTLIQGFPGASISLKGVALTDSLYKIHKHELLKAADINVSLNIFSLIAGKTKINKIAINDATIYIYTDSNGYSNTNIFRKKTKQNASDGSSPGLEINKIDFNRVSFTIDNQKRHKLFDFSIIDVKANIDYPDSGWKGKLKLNTFVKSFAFNTIKGSFLKDKEISGLIAFHYSNATEKITVNPSDLKIGNYTFSIGANIDLAEKSGAFAIDIAVDKILYRDVALMLSPNISSKLLKFGIEKPINIKGKIIDDGSGKYADPLIQVAMTVRENNLKIPAGELTDCNFDGSFTNRDTVGGIIGDENSAITFKKLSAKYFNAPFTVDLMSVKNLSRPIATGNVVSNFNLDVLNSSIGGNDFDFKSGTASLKLFCKADIDNFNFTKPVVSGDILIKDANILYVPRRLSLSKSQINIVFDQNNLLINNGHFQLGKSILNMSCNINNFLNLYYTAPEKILVNLNMNSPQLYLNELLPLLGPRNTKKTKSKSNNSGITEQLSKVLDLSKMDIKLNVKKAIYKKFVAEDLSADIALRGDGIFLNKIAVKNAGGSLKLNGNIKPDGNINLFKIQSTVSNVNVQQFFYSFDNFGIKSITSKNLKGYLSSLVNMSGKISNDGQIVPKSMQGKVALNLKNAALVNFEPLVNVGKYVFRSRNLSNLKINNLDGTFNINGDKIQIEPMQVNSSAINLNVKGLYSLGAGTNIEMDIPLRNPKGDELLDNKEKKSVRMDGFVLHLKAVDDDKGGVKLKWNKDRDKDKK